MNKIIVRQKKFPNPYAHLLNECLKVVNDKGEIIGTVENIKNVCLTGMPIEITIVLKEEANDNSKHE